MMEVAASLDIGYIFADIVTSFIMVLKRSQKRISSMSISC